MMIPMALNGGEPTAAMGVDVPIPPLSKQNPPLFDYFKQLFAQVTNPPIDSIRESVITDTTVYLGAAGNLLKEEEANCRVLKVENPILTSLDLMKIRDSHIEGLQTADISMLYTKDTSLADAISNLYAQADAAHDAGAAILILTDRGVDQEHLAIPSLLEYRCFPDCRNCRTDRSPSLCNFAWVWCKCSQSVSGTGYSV